MVTVIPKLLIYKDITYRKIKCHLLALVPCWYFDEDIKITKDNLDSWELYDYYLEKMELQLRGMKKVLLSL